MHYWTIKWKNYKEEPLEITEKQAEYLMAERAKSNRANETFTIHGEQYSFSSIDTIQKTTKKIESDTKLLYASAAQLLEKPKPIINEDGEVVTNWYKTLVDKREYAKYFSVQPDYMLLKKTDGGNYWMAFRKAEMTNLTVPDHLELCDKTECDQLWMRYNAG